MKSSLSFPVVFFDLDGTLVDSSRDIAVSVNHVREAMGMEALDEKLIESYIGDGVEKLFERALPSHDTEMIHQAIGLWRPLYENACMVYTDFYPGIRELLGNLRAGGARLGLLTNKPQKPTEIILEGFGVLDLFSVVVGGDSTPTRKPHPEMFEKALESLAVSAREVVHVGDAHNDVKGAKRAGLKSCGVTWGYGSHEEIKEADFVASDVAELAHILGV